MVCTRLFLVAYGKVNFMSLSGWRGPENPHILIKKIRRQIYKSVSANVISRPVLYSYLLNLTAHGAHTHIQAQTPAPEGLSTEGLNKQPLSQCLLTDFPWNEGAADP